MSFWRSVAGMIEVELTSASPEQTFAQISAMNIEIRNIRKENELTYSFLLPKGKERELKAACKKRGDLLKTKRRIGIYWVGKEACNRPVLLLGIVGFLVLALWLPTRVLFVRVEGNVEIPDRRILAAAEDCGIGFGASRREVRSERVKNALLCTVPQLQWAGVNTYGCTATVSVRERMDTEEQKISGEVASMLAERDGYVLSATATAGNLLVKPGDSVRKGQTLISAYTDCGICVRAERANGEVIAQTSRSMDVIMPSWSAVKVGEKHMKRKYSLLVGKKRIFLWKDSGIWDGSCGRMYEEYYITLPGEFQLPVALCVETYSFADTVLMKVLKGDAEPALKAYSEDKLRRTMIAGKILSGIQSVEEQSGCYHLRGNYVCMEMIGTIRQEQIGDTNGENG